MTGAFPRGAAASGPGGQDPPILELASALAEHDRGTPISLGLAAGDLLLVDAPDPDRASGLADLCAGLAPLAEGRARVLGHDWARLPRGHAAALRGRVGRAFGGGRGWIPYLSVADNVLLAQLHHTRIPEVEVRERAARLSAAFGLPGLPLGLPREQHPNDLARSACVRAFLGEPALLLLESPLLEGTAPDLLLPLLDRLVEARSRGAACLWLTRSALVWSDRSIPATRRLRLSERGLTPARGTPAATIRPPTAVPA